ncbi:hypothetical protein C2G38_2180375 [Gigaspora rosea]|uniref:Uncharacterized protein n=1 Tax=Gigaspora rosea TaxID=44941 RepID=A0A397VBZ0_9GLOM|nr:hypothetical protein C2G38_2180375 [Gigaspora rosea]
MTQSELLEFPNVPVPHYCGFKASDIGQCLYKIRDDSVRPRNFLGADDADGIEAILSDREGHSLHEFIDGDEPLCPIIDFNLPIETLNAIMPKILRKEVNEFIQTAFRDICLEINPKWDKKSKTVASSSDENKLSPHLYYCIIDNIANK